MLVIAVAVTFKIGVAIRADVAHVVVVKLPMLNYQLKHLMIKLSKRKTHPMAMDEYTQVKGAK
jgi:hypothetical protein